MKRLSKLSAILMIFWLLGTASAQVHSNEKVTVLPEDREFMGDGLSSHSSSKTSLAEVDERAIPPVPANYFFANLMPTKSRSEEQISEFQQPRQCVPNCLEASQFSEVECREWETEVKTGDVRREQTLVKQKTPKRILEQVFATPSPYLAEGDGKKQGDFQLVKETSQDYRPELEIVPGLDAIQPCGCSIAEDCCQDDCDSASDGDRRPDGCRSRNCGCRRGCAVPAVPQDCFHVPYPMPFTYQKCCNTPCVQGCCRHQSILAEMACDIKSRLGRVRRKMACPQGWEQKYARAAADKYRSADSCDSCTSETSCTGSSEENQGGCADTANCDASSSETNVSERAPATTAKGYRGFVGEMANLLNGGLRGIRGGGHVADQNGSSTN